MFTNLLKKNNAGLLTRNKASLLLRNRNWQTRSTDKPEETANAQVKKIFSQDNQNLIVMVKS